MVSVFDKYLSQYACPEVHHLPSFLLNSSQGFDLGVSLPLRGESLQQVSALLQNLSDLARKSGQRLLVVAVLNHHLKSSLETIQENHLILDSLNSRGVPRSGHFLLENMDSSLTVLWVDRASEVTFTPKQGVGLARKIGCDILCSLISRGILRTSWLWTTDADASLPLDYFEMGHLKAAAIHYTYRHNVSNFSGAEALTLYEIRLRHYFLGLHWAQSPFAYPTIGSCLAIQPESYVQVRGFPDRLAGEDFHLLNKLRKIGPVFYRRSSPVILRGRFSERVPFGTGQSTLQIFECLRHNEPYRIYAWDTFDCLKLFLSGAIELLAGDNPGAVDDLLNRVQRSYPGFLESARELGVPEILVQSFHLRKDPEQRIRHFHTCFDALKTLRLIHLLSDNPFPKLFWKNALEKNPYLSRDSWTSAQEALEILQKQDERLTEIIEKTSKPLGNTR